MGSNRRRSRLLTLAALIAIAPACGRGAGEPEPGFPDFPAEPVATDFPGISHAPFLGDLPRPGSLGGPVWLVGVDGATWDLIRPLARQGQLPNFARLLEQGAHGVLLSEEPTISPAVWATIATGMPRFEHGIVDFLVKLPGRYETVESGPLDRHAPAVWELVGSAGGRSAVIGWFGSYPAEEIDGYYVSKGFDPEDPHAGKVHPPSLTQALVERARVRLRRGDVESIARTEFLQETLVDDARRLAVLRVITSLEQPDFVAVYLSGIDVAQHLGWRHMDSSSQQFPQDGPPDPNLADVIPAYYRYVDHCLGEIVDLAPEGTTFVVVSDHGGGPMLPEAAYHFQLRVLLKEMGLMQGREGPVWAANELRRHDKLIWINVRGVEAEGIVPPGDARETARQVRRRLEALRTDAGEPVFAALIDHTEDLRWQPGEPAFTVRFSKHALVASEVQDGQNTIDFNAVRLRRPDVSGDHRLEGIVLLYGPSIEPGPLPGPANIYQVAPTLLYLLGLPQDGRMLRHAPADGGVLEAALPADLLDRKPVRMIEEYPGTDRSGLLRNRYPLGEPQPDPAAEQALERLRGLGYIR